MNVTCGLDFYHKSLYAFSPSAQYLVDIENPVNSEFEQGLMTAKPVSFPGKPFNLDGNNE